MAILRGDAMIERRGREQPQAPIDPDYSRIFQIVPGRKFAIVLAVIEGNAAECVARLYKMTAGSFNRLDRLHRRLSTRQQEAECENRSP